MTNNTPLFPAVGKLATPDTPRDSFVSFASVHHDLAPKSHGYTDKYSQFVIQYIVEWDRVITTRVDKGLKQAEILRRDLDHYQKKAETLRASASQVMSKGKTVDNKAQEKLARNEEKLLAAKSTYDTFATDMCIYLEELTQRSWKDLHPCLVKMAQFEMTISKEEAKTFGQMNQVVDQLKIIGDQHKLEAAGRLKELETQKPTILSTREPDAPSAITNGEAFGSFGGGPTAMGVGGDPWSQNQHLPPGSVAPQGMGGFPIAIATAPSSNVSRATSAGSFSSYNMNASDMIAIAKSAAPPPTMEELNIATTSLTMSGSGSYHNYGHQLSGSLYDDASTTSSITTLPIAPPPMSAPPPLPPSGYTSPMNNPYGFSPSYGAPAPMPVPNYGIPVQMPSYGAPVQNYGAPIPNYGVPVPMPNYGASPPIPLSSPPTGYPNNPYGAPPSF